jgi:hypothetical protein
MNKAEVGRNEAEAAARGLSQHGVPSGWLKASDPAGCDFVSDGRSMPPAVTELITCPDLGLIFKCTQNTIMSYVTPGKLGLL